MEDYTAIPELAQLVLEESYVLAVDEQNGSLEIRMDAALARDHPEIRPPRPGQYSYFREVTVRFENVVEFVWTRRFPPATDADGSTSWDGFDSAIREGDRYRFEGDAGLLTFRAARVECVWRQEP
jgi:hypothetical protein